EEDPASFSWIQKWAAIGDSFTAGIGAGNQLGQVFHNYNDWSCSRYDQSYPMLLNSAFGSAVEEFQFLACSGARSEGIYTQVTDKLGTDMNFVTLTAGGNDLCLAKENIDNILKPNLKSILLKLNDNMADDSIVVFNAYGQYFNTDDDKTCTEQQYWAITGILIQYWFSKALPLTAELRKKFNGLVIGINDAIKDVVNDVSKNGNVKYKIEWLHYAHSYFNSVADWDKWTYEGVRGQYCDPQGDGNYPDDKQPDLQFFKPDTRVREHTELRRKRGLEAYVPTQEEAAIMREYEELQRKDNIYDSSLWKSADPRAVARHRLSPRDTPSPPSCPGDNAGAIRKFIAMGITDSFGKNFHPNEKGHVTIASFAVDRLIKLRAEKLGKEANSCKVVDEFKCWQKDGSKGYAHPAVLDANYKDFCNTLDAPEHDVGWSIEKTYNEGTPDQSKFKIELTQNASEFDKDKCLEAFNKIIHSCDGSDSNNPMNWKFGGKWATGEYTYRVDIHRDNRPWPPPKEPVGDCRSEYKVLFNSIFIHGGGWATADFGQDTLKKQAGACIGSTPTHWKFWYYDKPDKDGNEWAASFNTPVFTRARCFNNDKVPNNSGGHVSGCGGTG
ncbi:hypothetical protein CI238_12827, partial [Colletotrichum incanum]